MDLGSKCPAEAAGRAELLPPTSAVRGAGRGKARAQVESPVMGENKGVFLPGANGALKCSFS